MNEQQKLIERFIQEAQGSAEPEYPDGKLNEDDEGTLTFAVFTDTENNAIIVQFSHPTTWIGLDHTATKYLIKTLTERLKELKPKTKLADANFDYGLE